MPLTRLLSGSCVLPSLPWRSQPSMEYAATIKSRKTISTRLGFSSVLLTRVPRYAVPLFLRPWRKRPRVLSMAVPSHFHQQSSTREREHQSRARFRTLRGRSPGVANDLRGSHAEHGGYHTHRSPTSMSKKAKRQRAAIAAHANRDSTNTSDEPVAPIGGSEPPPLKRRPDSPLLTKCRGEGEAAILVANGVERSLTVNLVLELDNLAVG